MVNSKRSAVCASACLFIYAAGVDRRGEVLGIHRPSFSTAAYQRMGLDEAAKKQSAAMKIFADYLREMGVSSPVIERMKNIGSEKIVWLSDAEISDVTGFIPEYTDWFKANCPPIIGRDGCLDRQKMFECNNGLLEAEQKKAKFRWLLKRAKPRRIGTLSSSQNPLPLDLCHDHPIRSFPLLRL